MIPTAKFRWLELPITGYTVTQHPTCIPVGDVTHTRRVRVLQQWWQSDVPAVVGDPNGDAVEYEGEWRDLVIEGEA